MPFNDGIDRIHSFSLGDFKDFEVCPFRFFVKHHLQQKYQLEEGSSSMAIGCLLDQSIKIFHLSKAYGQPKEYLKNIVKRARSVIKEMVQAQKEPSFYSAVLPFLDDQTTLKVIDILEDYYLKLQGRIKLTLGKVGFCEWVIKTNTGCFKLWGGPDTFEMGDNMPEVCDYKYFEDNEKGKASLDMDLMPKIYTLLSSNYLKSKGYNRSRFIIRFWQDPLDNSFYQEFDLDKLAVFEEEFKEKIITILNTKQITFCEKPFCRVCKSIKRQEYINDLGEKFGILVTD